MDGAGGFVSEDEGLAGDDGVGAHAAVEIPVYLRVVRFFGTHVVMCIWSWGYTVMDLAG